MELHQSCEVIDIISVFLPDIIAVEWAIFLALFLLSDDVLISHLSWYWKSIDPFLTSLYKLGQIVRQVYMFDKCSRLMLSL